MADQDQKELKALLEIRRVRLQRAESAARRARQQEKQCAQAVIDKQNEAVRAAEDNKRHEAELASNLFNRETVLSHIESFRKQVSDLRQGTRAAIADVETAKEDQVKAKVEVRESMEKQQHAYRAVEKLEYALQELRELDAASRSEDVPGA